MAMATPARGSTDEESLTLTDRVQVHLYLRFAVQLLQAHDRLQWQVVLEQLEDVDRRLTKPADRFRGDIATDIQILRSTLESLTAPTSELSCSAKESIIAAVTLLQDRNSETHIIASNHVKDSLVQSGLVKTAARTFDRNPATEPDIEFPLPG